MRNPFTAVPSALALTLSFFIAALVAGTASPGMGSDDAPITGTVAETMDSGGYTYLLLDQEGGKQWVAVPKMQVTVGDETLSVAIPEARDATLVADWNATLRSPARDSKRSRGLGAGED